MKYVLFILLMLLIVSPSFAQKKLSHADSLVLAQIYTVGPWKGTFYITQKGSITLDENAPNWPTEVLIDSFSDKSTDVKGVYDFVKANKKLLYRYFESEEFYFIVITNKEVIKIKVKNGKPQIDRREMPDNNSCLYYWGPNTKYVKRIVY